MGTDAPAYGLVPGTSLHEEIELLGKAGINQLEALRLATSVASSAIGLGHEVGRIAEGYRAELIMLGSNPLVETGALIDVCGTLSNGFVILPNATLGITR